MTIEEKNLIQIQDTKYIESLKSRGKDNKIGINHTAFNSYISNRRSSFSGQFSKNEMSYIGDGMEIVPCKIGNISDAYEILRNKLNAGNYTDFNDLCRGVFETVHEYFGDYSKIDERMNYYKDMDNIIDENDIGLVSDLQGKNSAMCVERAMLSQNLLKCIGINSYYKVCGTVVNNKPDCHAFNVIENHGQYYIFDSTIPTVINDAISPIVAQIPEEVYYKIISPRREEGYSVEISHYNPLQKENYNIIYDAGRSNLYECSEKKGIIK